MDLLGAPFRIPATILRVYDYPPIIGVLQVRESLCRDPVAPSALSIGRVASREKLDQRGIHLANRISDGVRHIVIPHQ
uniref:hypothetical protein n=1 Tax=Nesterenkonia sp. AY15 TaxID=2901139 RepID=UPI001F4D31F8|nr:MULTISPECIES: hypothetical protein [unclassified Nesterenkonia]